MKKTLIAGFLLSAVVAPVMAQTAAPALTGNVSLISDYRFRGIDQTFGRPALQGGLDYTHASGLYLGNWNSNVSSGAGFPDGNLEMDFYGGYKANVGDVGLDVGAIYYYYPGSEAKVLGTNAKSGAVNNQEVYVGASWKFLSLKYSLSVADYFSTRGVDSAGAPTGQSTRGSGYWDLSANYDLGDGWGVNGHVGQLSYKNVANGDYTDWKIGVTKDIGGWIVGASYVDTNAKGSCSGASGNQPYCLNSTNTVNGNDINRGSRTTDAGKGIGIVSLSHSF
ncbi:MAG: TorF family putative porin [Pseudomonadota bacterium]